MSHRHVRLLAFAALLAALVLTVQVQAPADSRGSWNVDVNVGVLQVGLLGVGMVLLAVARRLGRAAK